MIIDDEIEITDPEICMEWLTAGEDPVEMELFGLCLVAEPEVGRDFAEEIGRALIQAAENFRISDLWLGGCLTQIAISRPDLVASVLIEHYPDEYRRIVRMLTDRDEPELERGLEDERYDEG